MLDLHVAPFDGENPLILTESALCGELNSNTLSTVNIPSESAAQQSVRWGKVRGGDEESTMIPGISNRNSALVDGRITNCRNVHIRLGKNESAKRRKSRENCTLTAT